MWYPHEHQEAWIEQCWRKIDRKNRFLVDFDADDESGRRPQADGSLCISALHSTASGSVQKEPRVARRGEVRQDAIAVFWNGIGEA